MPKLNIVRSIHINAPVEKVYKTVNDFNHWTAWSPWLIMDPNATVDVSDSAKYYSWEGSRVGSGNMTVIREELNKTVDYDLVFLKPWKSKAKVRFEIKPSGDGADVSWYMDSSLPFFMFWMKKSMTAFIQMDYDRGLNMLKDYVEDGEVHSKLNFKGIHDFEGFRYVGITTNSSMDDLGNNMKSDLDRLFGYFKDQNDMASGVPFSIYHKWDMVRKQVSYTSGVPVNQIPDNLPSGFNTGSIPSGKCYTLEHIGAYRHLGNAWSTIQNMIRNKEFKPLKGVHPFETYNSDPREVSENDLVTGIHFMVKE